MLCLPHHIAPEQRRKTEKNKNKVACSPSTFVSFRKDTPFWEAGALQVLILAGSVPPLLLLHCSWPGQNQRVAALGQEGQVDKGVISIRGWLQGKQEEEKSNKQEKKEK